ALPEVRLHRSEVLGIPDDPVTIVATGPLTSQALAAEVAAFVGQAHLHFFDAVSPVVEADSIDFDKAFRASRYGKGGDDYLNCPMSEAEYRAFHQAVTSAECASVHDFEKELFFEGCLPVEVIASRGVDTLRFGPMKPVGLCDPRTGRRPYAVVQLRQDNALGTLWNMVGFQTKLKHGEQTRVFRMIPGLENAQFARLGGLHRNTFINSPKLLDGSLKLKARPSIRFAGQVTGVEGYVESAAIGLLAGRFASAEARGEAIVAPPPTTAFGALLAHITGGADEKTFQPMNVNFGLFPELKGARGKDRKKAMSHRAIADLEAWLKPAAQAAE